MKKDVRIKIRPGVSITPKIIQQQLVYLLELSQDLATTYRTYPRLSRMVGYAAWQSLTDVAYEQLLKLNLNPENQDLRDEIIQNLYRLEDIAASTLVRDEPGLRDTLARVLQFRIINGEATR